MLSVTRLPTAVVVAGSWPATAKNSILLPSFSLCQTTDRGVNRNVHCCGKFTWKVTYKTFQAPPLESLARNGDRHVSVA